MPDRHEADFPTLVQVVPVEMPIPVVRKEVRGDR